MFENQSEIETYTYPQDLGSATRGHSITFTIKEIDDAGINSNTTGSTVSNGLQTLKNVLTGSGSESSGAATTGAADAPKSTQVTETIQTAVKQLIQPPRTTLKSTIQLYMPDTVTESYEPKWTSQSMSEIFGDNYNMAAAGVGIASKVVQGKGIDVLNTAGNSPQGRILAAKAVDTVAGGSSQGALLAGVGAALNPQAQVLFETIDFRNFSYSFTFTPRSAQESQTVNRIINIFKYYAAPGMLNTQAADQGSYFRIPALFKIEYRMIVDDGNGNMSLQLNPWVNKIADCALTGINVDYAPNGWSTHVDGSPVQTKLTLQFMETQIITRELIGLMNTSLTAGVGSFRNAPGIGTTAEAGFVDQGY